MVHSKRMGWLEQHDSTGNQSDFEENRRTVVHKQKAMERLALSPMGDDFRPWEIALASFVTGMEVATFMILLVLGYI